MRVLVTGGAGFIGSHLVDRLAARGDAVTVLDNLDPQVHGDTADVPQNLAGHLERGAVHWVRGDVRDPAAVARSLEGSDAVVHLAAAVGVGQSMYEPHYYTSVNVDGQGVLMEALAREPSRWRRFVVASSMSVYGEGAYRCEAHGALAPQPRDEDRLAAGVWEVPCPVCGGTLVPQPTPESKPLQRTSVYAVTKKAQEELALCFGNAYRVPTLALRFFNVYGSRQSLSNPYTGVAAIFLARLKNGSAPIIYEDGAQSRDFIHVHDAADAVVAALDAPANVDGAVNVCTGRAVTVRQVAEVLADRLGVPTGPAIAGKYRSGDIRHCVGDPGRARAALGFTARVGFPEGVDELIAWSAGEEAEDRVSASHRLLVEQGLVY
jgi:dTDP-L-rhamnose 4-epimerase